ncbi:hypothetical protein JCM3765_001406 [Sporobolomyces pararoseus]
MPVTETTKESCTTELKWTFDEAEILQLRAEGERSISRTFGDGCWKLKLCMDDNELKLEPMIMLSALPQLRDIQAANSDEAWIRRGSYRCKITLISPSITFKPSQKPIEFATTFSSPKSEQGGKSPVSLSKMLSWAGRKDPTPPLLKQLSSFFDNPISADVAFAVHGKRGEVSHIFASKSFLVSSSSYMEKILNGETSLNVTQKVLDLKDFEEPPKDSDSLTREVLERDFAPFYTPKTSHELAIRQGPNVDDRHSSLTPLPDEAAATEERPIKRIKVEEEVDRTPKNGKEFTVVEIKDTDYRTYRAMIAYLHSQVVPFYSLSAHYFEYGSEDEDPIEWLQRDFDDIKAQTDYGGVQPCSVNAMYRLADAYQLVDLKKLCLDYILSSLTPERSAYVLFSPLSLEYSAVQDSLLKSVVQVWSKVKKTESFKVVLEKFSAGELAKGKDLMGKMFDLMKA